MRNVEGIEPVDVGTLSPQPSQPYQPYMLVNGMKLMLCADKCTRDPPEVEAAAIPLLGKRARLKRGRRVPRRVGTKSTGILRPRRSCSHHNHESVRVSGRRALVFS